jgi:hypothetical protein
MCFRNRGEGPDLLVDHLSFHADVSRGAMRYYPEVILVLRGNAQLTEGFSRASAPMAPVGLEGCGVAPSQKGDKEPPLQSSAAP